MGNAIKKDGARGTPRVSVVIPAFNAEFTIGETIESILHQTVTDLEIIVVDDASTDSTAAIVESYRDERIQLVRLKNNVGGPCARNIGIEHASGVWLAVTDADDTWAEERLENLLRLSPEANCFVTDYLIPAAPNADGMLVPLSSRDTRSSGSIEDLERFSAYLRVDVGMRPIYPLGFFRIHHIEFPEGLGGGEWDFVAAKAFLNGLTGKLLRWPGYLYRISGYHRGSTLRAIGEQLKVEGVLSSADWLDEEARAFLVKRKKGIRKRLLVAALRERRFGEFLKYACKKPCDLGVLPKSLFWYVVRRVRLFFVMRRQAR